MAKSQLRQYVFTPVAGAGTIEVPGKFDLQQLLVITNTTRNTIIYNFADPTFSGTTVTFNRANDLNFISALDNTDGTTTITLVANSTTGMSSTDTLQIFYESAFQYVRSPEIGTDAFERQRVAAPQSLLDADFEYGMQPTKWLTISQQRGYPAIYEIPGTDLTVTAATTDASSGSGGFATSESLITITTASAHGYTVGQPITIRGFNSAYTGFDRAEGSFVVYSTPSTTTFTYVAKGKVGYNNNDNIYTPFIQLRQGGFYSGSNINAVVAATITATNPTGNLLTVSNTTGMTVGAPITISTVTTNAIATNSGNNYVTFGTTVGMAVGMPLYFSGTSFGGLISGTTYYVQSIVDTRTAILVTTSGGSTNPTLTTAIGGNMYVVGGANFGNLVSGTQYYIASIPTPGANGTITISNNIVYTTNITATYVSTNYVTFGTTTNMVVGEAVVTGASGNFGGLSASATYYVIQIIDSRNAILSATLGGSAVVLSTATGTLSATVGTPIAVSSASGYLAAIAVNNPTFTYTTPSSVSSFTASLSGSTLTITAIASGTIATGQALAGATGIPSGSVITAQLTATGASAVATPTYSAGGAPGAFSFTVSSGTGIIVGQIVSGTGVPNSTFVTNVNGTVITLSNAFTTQAAGTYSFYTAYGIGTYSVSTSTGSVSSTNAFTTVATQATITVSTTSPHGFTPGDTINVTQSSDTGSNNHILVSGPFFVESTPSNSTFTYTARGVGVITGTVVGQIYARPDSFYAHRPFDGGVQLGTGLPAHGSQAIRMSKKYIRYQSGKAINFNTGLLMAPNYFVRSVYANALPVQTGVAITAVTNTTGGITIANGTYVQGEQIVITTTVGGSLLPSGTYYVAVGGVSVVTIALASTYLNAIAGTTITTTAGSVTATATVNPMITITTDDVDHGCQIGANVTLSGVQTSGYNGSYTVAAIIDERNIAVAANQTLTASTGVAGATVSDPCLLSVNNWTGATVRSGTFDEQNGVFFQYDGQVVGAVRRSSTFQLAGTVTVYVGSGQIVGINTRFTSQLFAGDRIVIRGMSHVVTQVVSDSLMYVNPQYRGYQSVSGIKITKTIDRVVPQSQWNMDRVDGSNGPFNPSGYQLKPNTMNMVCVQWTWYGAGFIDWMMRGPEGKYITVHRLRNNNLNNEAWMRAGNLPVRYEVSNEAARGYIVGSVNVGNADTVIPMNDTTYFPVPTVPAGQSVFVDNEIINYTGKINTYATATSSSGNTVTVVSTANMAVGQPIVFLSQSSAVTAIGNLISGTTYYIVSINGNNLTISTSSSLTPTMTQVTATATSLSGYMTVNALVGCTRSQTIAPWASGGQRTFSAGAAASHTPQTGVILINGTASPIVSHWGAAFIEDGGFDSDRSYIFNYQVTNVPLTTKKTTAFAIRLAPSVSNALPGDLGARELINRASFLLQQLESSAGSGGTNAALVIEGVINPSNMPSLSNIQFNSLNSVVNPTGQPSFSQVAPGTSMVFTGAVNNFLTVPIALSAGATTIPTTTNPATASSGAIAVGDDVYFPTSTSSLYGLTKVSSLLSSTSTFTSTISTSTTASISSGSITGTTFTATTVGSGSIAVGMVLTGTNVATGTYITGAIAGGTGSGSTWTVSISQTTPPTSITATAVTATVTAGTGTIQVGSLLTGGGVTANTYITGQISGTTGGSGAYSLVSLSGGATVSGTPTGGTFYGVTINQGLLTAAPLVVNGSQVNLSRATYALPGETVFSYINSPANKDALDLSNLKELTNTPIGGRGAYPNGCDIMFINAYITQGSPINQNLVLRWGEAQA